MRSLWSCYLALLRLSGLRNGSIDRKIVPDAPDIEQISQNNPLPTLTVDLNPKLVKIRDEQRADALDLFSDEEGEEEEVTERIKTEEVEYRLRRLSSNLDYFTKDEEVEVMKSKIFGWESEIPLSINEKSLSELYNTLFKDYVYGPMPSLPFPSIASFFDYLFLECRDLRLIQLLLKLCQNNPVILKRFDSDLRRGRACSNVVGAREYLMLPFLVEMEKVDVQSFYATLQLMGFTNISGLLRFYANNPDITEIYPPAQAPLEYLQGRFNYLQTCNDSEVDYEFINETME